MTRYLISFPSGAMEHIPDEESPAVGEAAHAVVQEAMDAGVWVFGGGLAEDVDREAALEWAAKIAAACRCAQEIREFMPDPAVGN
jgi:hypothetical protein